MEPILISACLLGAACRYDGGSKPVLSVEALMGRYQLVPVCPEQLGGLPTPREPSERQGDLVVMKSGADVTAQYQRGAEQALHLARVFGCKKAVLKERSPSCGSGEIYDGTFSGKLSCSIGKSFFTAVIECQAYNILDISCSFVLGLSYLSLFNVISCKHLLAFFFFTLSEYKLCSFAKLRNGSLRVKAFFVSLPWK